MHICVCCCMNWPPAGFIHPATLTVSSIRNGRQRHLCGQQLLPELGAHGSGKSRRGAAATSRPVTQRDAQVFASPVQGRQHPGVVGP